MTRRERRVQNRVRQEIEVGLEDRSLENLISMEQEELRRRDEEEEQRRLEEEENLYKDDQAPDDWGERSVESVFLAEEVGGLL
jgi:hypothetical protein